MSTHDKIELPPLPPLHIAPSVEPVDYPKVAQALMDYARAAIEADRKRRREPTAAEISDVVREITGCPDIKSGEKSLVVALGMLFHRCAITQPAEPVKITCKKCNGTGVESTRFHGVWPNGEECLEPIKCDQCDGFGTTSAAEPVSQHPDDAAVDAFAAAMKAKLKRARDEKGRGGWQDMSAAELSAMLREHVEKGDPVDVANLAMMLHQNGQGVTPAEPDSYVHTAPDDCETLHWRGQILSLNELAAISAEPVKVPSDDLAHEIWAAAQLAPGEGIVDGVASVEALLRKAARPTITHCDNCGCDWVDNGLNPVDCPYCKLRAALGLVEPTVMPVAWRSVGGSIWGHKTSYDDEPLYGAELKRERDMLMETLLARTAEKDALLRQALEALERGAWDTLRGRNAAEAIRNHLGVKND